MYCTLWSGFNPLYDLPTTLLLLIQGIHAICIHLILLRYIDQLLFGWRRPPDHEKSVLSTPGGAWNLLQHLAYKGVGNWRLMDCCYPSGSYTHSPTLRPARCVRPARQPSQPHCSFLRCAHIAYHPQRCFLQGWGQEDAIPPH